MPVAMTFGEVLDAADALPLEDQEELSAILARRIVAARRRRFVREVEASRAEVAAGLAVPKTVEEIMAEALR